MRRLPRPDLPATYRKSVNGQLTRRTGAVLALVLGAIWDVKSQTVVSTLAWAVSPGPVIRNHHRLKVGNRDGKQPLSLGGAERPCRTRSHNPAALEWRREVHLIARSGA